MKTPDFDALVGDDVGGEERARLRRAHDALVTAGPPPELPARLGQPRASTRGRLLALAAAIAVAAAFAGGWVARGGGEGPDFTLAMRGTPAAASASAELDVFAIDEAGNWPMEMTVSGLADGRYELVLTRGGEPVASCGAFLVRGRTVARLNAPYRLKEYDGWAIVRPGSDRILLRTSEI
ncbi:MAG: hypothetical protein WD689_00405 [Gaiellaceae bacterium]